MRVSFHQADKRKLNANVSSSSFNSEREKMVTEVPNSIGDPFLCGGTDLSYEDEESRTQISWVILVELSSVSLQEGNPFDFARANIIRNKYFWYILDCWSCINWILLTECKQVQELNGLLGMKITLLTSSKCTVISRAISKIVPYNFYNSCSFLYVCELFRKMLGTKPVLRGIS